MVYRCIVIGKVQGVFYRKSVCANALKQGFKGHVKNLPDGSVEALGVCCDAQSLKNFKQILKQGSPLSIVDKVVVQIAQDKTAQDFETFLVIY